jgi:hypothetical protein
MAFLPIIGDKVLMQTVCKQRAGRAGAALSWSLQTTGLTKILGGTIFLALLWNPIQALSAMVSPGQSVTLAWNRGTNSGIAGYNLYYGGASGDYTNVISGNGATSVTIYGLIPGATYYFAATSYSLSGAESDLSGEVSYTVPAPLSSEVSSAAPTTLSSQVSSAVPAALSSEVSSAVPAPLSSEVPSAAPAPLSSQVSSTAPAPLSSEVSSTVPAPPAGLTCQVTAAGQFVLTVTGPAGQTYEIQATQDFKTWTVIGAVTVGAAGSLDFCDTNAPSFSSRFYRVQ